MRSDFFLNKKKLNLVLTRYGLLPLLTVSFLPIFVIASIFFTVVAASQSSSRVYKVTQTHAEEGGRSPKTIRRHKQDLPLDVKIMLARVIMGVVCSSGNTAMDLLICSLLLPHPLTIILLNNTTSEEACGG